jgi:hypothetical protein
MFPKVGDRVRGKVLYVSGSGPVFQLVDFNTNIAYFFPPDAPHDEMERRFPLTATLWVDVKEVRADGEVTVGEVDWQPRVGTASFVVAKGMVDTTFGMKHLVKDLETCKQLEVKPVQLQSMYNDAGIDIDLHVA